MQNFIKFAQDILDVAVNQNAGRSGCTEKYCLLTGRSIGERVTEQVGIIGEKLDLSFYGKIEAAQVIPYIHPGNKLATLVGLNKAVDVQVGKDIAMQVAAMNPVAVDKSDVSSRND